MNTLKHKLHEVIFEADTKAGKLFDVVLLWFILTSVLCVVIESISGLDSKFVLALKIAEWIFTILFTFEYILRVYCVNKSRNYIFSFFGIIDLFSILPTYLGLLFTGTHFISVVRAVRLLRVFRILKLARYLGGANEIATALNASRGKIVVFLGFVTIVILCMGSVLYVIEGPENGFTSIPTSMYWAVVTMTTVGFGDITPQTPLGQFISACVMILGYGIIAVPTGIVSSELKKFDKIMHVNTQSCQNCNCSRHAEDAIFCKICGNKL